MLYGFRTWDAKERGIIVLRCVDLAFFIP